MSNFQLIFICFLVVVQCTIGVALVYRGFSMLLESFQVESWKQQLSITLNNIKSAMSSPLGKKITLALLFVVPGSVPMLIAVALWRNFKHLRRSTSNAC